MMEQVSATEELEVLESWGLLPAYFAANGDLSAAAAATSAALGPAIISLNLRRLLTEAPLLCQGDFEQRQPCVWYVKHLHNGRGAWLQALPGEDESWRVLFFPSAASPLGGAVEKRLLGVLGHTTAKLGHDFNNLMGSIMGCADLLRHKIQKLSPAAATCDRQFEIIARSLKKSQWLTNQMRGFLRLEEPSRDEVDLGAAVREAWEQIDPAAREQCSLELKGPVDFKVTMPGFQLQQMLRFLLQNAVDAQSGQDHSRVEVKWTPLGAGGWELTMEDWGDADPETMARGLEPLVSRRPAGIGKGLGLGLPMAAALLAELGGRLSWRCKEDGGVLLTMSWEPSPRSLG